MSPDRYNPVVEDMSVAVQAGLYDLDRRQAGRGLSDREHNPLYGTPAPTHALRPMRCAYPRCASEAAVRCGGCRRIYCVDHCQGRLVWSKDARPECTRCARHLPRDSIGSQTAYPTCFAVGAVILFLLTVSLGIAIDVSARADGRIALWISGGAFLVFAHHMDRP